MSYGTRKAIAGTMRGVERAVTAAREAVTRFDACETEADIRGVLAWAKGHDWFLCPGEDHRSIRAAYDRAKDRVESPFRE